MNFIIEYSGMTCDEVRYSVSNVINLGKDCLIGAVLMENIGDTVFSGSMADCLAFVQLSEMPNVQMDIEIGL